MTKVTSCLACFLIRPQPRARMLPCPTEMLERIFFFIEAFVTLKCLTLARASFLGAAAANPDFPVVCPMLLWPPLAFKAYAHTKRRAPCASGRRNAAGGHPHTVPHTSLCVIRGVGHHSSFVRLP